MSVTYVIQARMGSTRLPGKVLMDLGGRPMLAFMLERLSSLTDGPVVVATSELDRDDPIAEVAGNHGAEVVRGDETDVLSRYVSALERFPADVVVRLTADCPLIDPDLVRAAVKLRAEHDADYASNALIRTYPDGLDVEAFTATALYIAASEGVAGPEREHVTPFVYRHPERFDLVTLRNDEPLGDERWTVDRPEDLAFVRDIVGHFGGRSDFGWRDVLERIGRRNRPEPGELHLRPAMPEDRDLLRGWRNDPSAVATSGTGRPVGEDEHESWFARKLVDGGSHLLIAECDGRPAGYVRIDVEAAVGTVSIIVAPEERSQGLGSRLLLQAVDHARSGCQIAVLDAEVSADNAASLRVFEKAGFEIVSPGPFHRLARNLK